MGTAVTNARSALGRSHSIRRNRWFERRTVFNLYTMDLANPCTQGFQSGAANSNKSGIIFFPGSAGLFRNGALAGGLGVSGDGVDQDDYVAAAARKDSKRPQYPRGSNYGSGRAAAVLQIPRNPSN